MPNIRSSTMVAHAKGAWSANPANRELWDLSKRELIEVVLHLAAVGDKDSYTALADGTAANLAMQEYRVLKLNGLV